MIKRWLIRALFLLPLGCMAGLWVTSYFRGLGLLRVSPSSEIEIGAVRGLAFVDYNSWHLANSRPPDHGYFIHREAHSPTPTTTGFAWHTLSGFPGLFTLVFPLWLPALLLLSMNYFVWRKTKPKLIGGAFPVEPTSMPGGSKP